MYVVKIHFTSYLFAYLATRTFKIVYGAHGCSSEIFIDGTALDS